MNLPLCEYSLFSPCDNTASAYDTACYDMEFVDSQKQLSLPSSTSNSRKASVGQRLTEPEECGIVRDRDDEFHITRHVGLLLALSFSMFVVCFGSSL